MNDQTNIARSMIRPLRAPMLQLLQELVRVNSVSVPPNGNETPAQELLRGFLSQYGVRTDFYEIAPILEQRRPAVHSNRNYLGRKNLSASIEGKGTGRSLLLNGHMDTVPPGRIGWSESPWSGNHRNGRIHGLGAFDMKGGLVANAGVICALKSAGVRLGGDLFFESVVDEEWGGGGGSLAARLRGTKPDACVITEGTQLEIYRATRGAFIVDLVVAAGDSMNYFSPQPIAGAAIPLARILTWVENWANRRQNVQNNGAYSKIQDPAPVQVLAIEANRFDPEVPLSVPTRAAVRVYFQFLPHEDVEALVCQINDSIRTLGMNDPYFSRHPIQMRPLLDRPLWGQELPSEHPLVECVSNGVRKALESEPTITAAPYPCDAGLIQREFDIPTLLFGPSGAGAHNPNEYVEFESVIQTAEVLLAATLEWTNS